MLHNLGTLSDIDAVWCSGIPRVVKVTIFDY